MILSSSSSFTLSSFSRQWHAAAGSKTRPVSSSNLFCRHHRIHFTSSSSYSIRWVCCDPGSSSYPNKLLPCRGASTMSGRIPQPPWLMLPPAEDIEDHDYDDDYEFYSLAQKEVVSFDKTDCRGDKTDLVGLVANFCNRGRSAEFNQEDRLVGSSHGWLVFFNRKDGEIMFLSDPVSDRNIKLPPIDTLIIHKWTNLSSAGCVTSVVISGSPDQEEEECRAMMIYARDNRLAFCCPRRSLEWTPIGNVYAYDDQEAVTRSYESVVYSSRQKLFFCVTESLEFEAWDLSDPRSPRRVSMDDVQVDDDDGRSPWPNYRKEYLQRQFLVMAEHSDELFLVRQFARPRKGATVWMRDHHHRPTWTYSDSGVMPYKTVRFGVHRYDPVARAFNYIHAGAGSSLDGLAMFVGLNHGFALRADEYPELKPNSIYFTDREYDIGWGRSNDDHVEEEDDERDFGGHVGIFNYEDATFSPYYYPSDYPGIYKLPPAHAWFTPNPLL